MTFATEDRPPDLWLERNLVMLAAVIADDLEPLSGIVAFSRLLRAALSTALRRHHVPLVKDLLFLFGEKESVFTLNASGLNVRHGIFSRINVLR